MEGTAVGLHPKELVPQGALGVVGERGHCSHQEGISCRWVVGPTELPLITSSLKDQITAQRAGVKDQEGLKQLLGAGLSQALERVGCS